VAALGGGAAPCGFFASRGTVRADLGIGSAGDLIDYLNMPSTIGMVVSSGKATFAELDSVLGLEDLYDILEVIIVDGHNARVIAKERTRK
jgi:hypothetical protein